MAGRPATISDLFTPMQSIQSCMESNANAVQSGIETLNESILGCSSSMSVVSKSFKRTVDNAKAQTVSSIKELKKSSEKIIKEATAAIAKSISDGMGGVAAASAAAATAATAPMGMLGEVMQQNAVIMSNMLNETVAIGKTVSDLKKLVKKNGKDTTDAIEKSGKGGANKGGGASEGGASEGGSKKGGKFQGLKDLADAALKFKELSLKDAIMMKSKVKRVLAAAREMEDFGKDFDAEGAKGLAETLGIIGESSAKFIASLGAVFILAPFAILTAKMLKPTIKFTLDALSLISGKEGENYKNAAETLGVLASSSIKFLAVMALSTILAPIAMVGTAMFGLLMLETKGIFSIISDKETKQNLDEGSDNLREMGWSALMFEATMALSVILAPIAMIGVGLNALVIGGTATLFSTIGDKRKTDDIRRGVWTVELMCLGIVTFALTMLATTMIMKYLITGGGDKVDWMNVVAVASILPMFGVMWGSSFVFKKIGDNAEDIIVGGLDVMFMSAATILFALSLLGTYMITKSIVGDVFKDGKFDMMNVAALASVVGVFGLMLAANAVFRRIGKQRSVQESMQGAASVFAMSLALVSFAGAMWVTHQMTKNIITNADTTDIWAGIADVAVLFLMMGANYVFRRLGKEKTVKETIAGGVSVVAMSIGLVTFAGAMWVTHQMTKNIISNANGDDIGALVADVAIFALMLGGNYIFRRLGDNNTVKESAKGLVSILCMSVGIIAFAGAMWVSHKIAKQIVGDADAASIVTTLGIFALMVGSVFLFKFAGNALADIAKGTAAMLLMAIGIGAFGFGLKFFTDAVKDCKWWQLIALPALVLAFGVEFAALGIPMVAGFVALGSAAVAAMGVALVPFGWGVGKYAEYVREAGLDLATVAEMAGLIMLFGVEMSLIGPLSPLIIASDVAMGVMGVALVSFGWGVGKYADYVRESKIDVKTLLKMAGLIGVFAAEFAAIGPLTPLILLADAAIGVMGGSLYLIGKGVGEYAGAINKSKVGVKTIITMAGIIGTFALEFSALSLVSGFIAAGSAAGIAMGAALLSMGKGLQEFAAAKLNPKSINVFSEMMIKLRDTFAVMAGSGDAGGKGGLLGTMFRATISAFSPSGVEEGIRVTKKMGEGLYSIAKGLVEFQNGIGDKITDKQFMKDFAESVSTCVSSIAGAFKTVGESWTTKKSPIPNNAFGQLFHMMTFGIFGDKTKNAVEEGIKAVRGMGESLKDIANGLKEFKDLVPNAEDAGWVGQVGSNIALMLDALVGPLTKFGTVEEEVTIASSRAQSIHRGFATVQSSVDNTVNYNSKKVDIARAMENVGEVGKLIEGMANGIKTFSEIDPKKDIGTAFTVNDDWSLGGNGGGMIGNIQQMLCGFFPAFIIMGKRLYETGTFDEVVEAAKYEKGGLFGGKSVKTQDARTEKKSYVGMAIEAAKGIGDIVVSFAEGMKTFSETYKDTTSLMTGVSNVVKAISTILTGFGNIGAVICTGSGGVQPVLPAGAENGFDFGKMHGNIRRLRYGASGQDMTDVFSKINDGVGALIKGVGENVKSIKENLGTVSEVNKGMSEYIMTLMNLSAAALVMTDHTSADRAFIYSNKRIESYELQTFNLDIVKRANDNVGEMKTAVSKVVDISKNISGIPVDSGKRFTAFTQDLVKGMNTLASTSNNVSAATKFINSLTKAKNNNVFDNIATNTERIAQAFNSIRVSVMKPYAEMIAGMGEMAKRTSASKKIMDDIKELVEEMVAKISELGKVKVEVEKDDKTPTSGSGKVDNGSSTPQTVTADVKFDEKTLKALNTLSKAIENKFGNG